MIYICHWCVCYADKVKKLTPQVARRHGAIYGTVLAVACLGVELSLPRNTESIGYLFFAERLYPLSHYIYPYAALGVGMIIGGYALRRLGYYHPFRFSIVGGLVSVRLPLVFIHPFVAGLIGFYAILHYYDWLSVGGVLFAVALSAVLGTLVFWRIGSKIPGLSQRSVGAIWPVGSAWFRRHRTLIVVLIMIPLMMYFIGTAYAAIRWGRV